MTPAAFLRIEFGLTPLAAPFVGLLAVLAFAVALWGWRERPAERAVLGLFVLAMLGVLLARSLTAFAGAWELMSLVSALLVATHHEQRRVRRATLTYLLVAQGGALCIIVALTILALAAGSTEFSAIAANAPTLAPVLRTVTLALALIGFGSKAGLVPLHFWLPRAHPVAPASASALLSGVMLKVAVYGLCLVMFVLAAPASLAWGVTLIVLGTISAVVGVLYALVDHDLKRLLAYHSIENIGIIAIGIGAAVAGLATHNLPLAGIALLAALFHTINHGLFKGLLFLGAGTVARTEGTVDLERLGGLWVRLRWTAPFFLVGCIAIAGLPPFNGFVSEWLTFQALIAGLAGGTLGLPLICAGAIAGLALTSGLAVACFVKVFGVAFLGQRRSAVPHPAPSERFDGSAAGLGVLALLCAVLGLAPLLVVAPLAGVVAQTLAVVVPSLPTLPTLSVWLVALPFLGALGALGLAFRRGVRSVPTWTCGSPVTAAAQYTATAFAKPLRTVFAFLVLPERRRIVELGVSRWFPRAIRYHTRSRYLIDELARRVAAITLRWTRRTRALQSGELRLYLAYGVAAFVVTVVLVR